MPKAKTAQSRAETTEQHARLSNDLKIQSDVRYFYLRYFYLRFF